MNKLRYYQEECIQAMRDAEKKFSIYQLFCGTGKTNIFTTYLEEEKLGVVVMAFPRISLVHQYNMDYYEKRDSLRKRYKHYIVSTDHESKDAVVEFAEESSGGRLILTTHTSFLDVCNRLLDAGVEIDSVIIDEVHHFGSKKNMDTLENLDVGEIFGFTATPANKFQQEKIEYQYGYSEALRDGYCKPFEVDLYVTEDEKNPENLYKGLFYLAEKTRVNNVLCFHAFSEVDGKQGKSSVSQYKNIASKVEFGGTYFTDGIKSHTITGKMNNSTRLAVLNSVSNAKKKQLNILHSCNTISEGIDTKAIKSICFPDAKGSSKAIIQAIGRITRLDPTTDDPSRVFIPFFEVTRDGIVEGDFGEESDEESLDGESGDERLAGDTLVNETAYRTILGIIEFLKADNVELFNAALENPNILTKEEYEFHFAKVIVNKGGNMYVGKTLDEIRERNVMVCTTDKDGDIISLGDFLDDEKTVTKETGVDEWVYLYVDAETEVVKANLGRGKRAATTRKPRKLVVFGNPEDAAVVLCVARGSGKKTRLEKINDLLDWVRENKKLPFHKEEHGSFFTTLKNIEKGTAKGSVPFSPDEITALEEGLKTKDWTSLTDETFQRHIEEFLDPEVELVDYVVVTRLDKINVFLDWVRGNKKLPAARGEHGVFFTNLKNIAKGTKRGYAPLSPEETTALEEGLKTKNWTSLTDETFQRHMEEFLDPKVKRVDYVVVTRLDKINDLLDWVRENKKLPFPKEEHCQFFAKLKMFANGTSGRDTTLSLDEITALEEGLKTKDWTSLTDETFQRHIDEFLDPKVKWVDYVVVTRLVKINDFLDWVRENKKLPFPKEEHGMFFATLKGIANGTTKTFTPLSSEETSSLSQGLKTKDWASLTNETFQRHVEEFLDPKIRWVNFVVVTRLVKINDLLEWVRENKKLPFPKEEHGTFFAALKRIANGATKGSAPFSTEEIDALEKGLKTKDWASLTDKIFKKAIKEFLDPEVEWIDYSSVTATPAEKTTATPVAKAHATPAAKTTATPAAKSPATPAAKPPVAPTIKPFAAKSLESVKSFIEDGDSEGKKKLATLQSLKSGTRKTGTLYTEVEEYLAGIDAEWWKKKPEEIRGATAAAPRATQAVAPRATTSAVPQTSAVDIIFDYDDALSSGGELSSQLKKSLRVLYKEKNPRLLKFIENRKITAEEFLDHVI